MHYVARAEIVKRLEPVVPSEQWPALDAGPTVRLYELGLRHGVLTRDEFDAAERVMASHWHYTGT